MNPGLPVLGFCAWGSGAGKTTLLTRLIPELAALGVRASVIKHAHHQFDLDTPGKDSYRLREAGAAQTMLASSGRWVLMTELAAPHPDETGLSIDDLIAHMDARLADLVLVEGFRNEAIPKIEVYRPSLEYPLIAESDPGVIAVATDAPVTCHVPVLDLNDATAIARFVADWLKKP